MTSQTYVSRNELTKEGFQIKSHLALARGQHLFLIRCSKTVQIYNCCRYDRHFSKMVCMRLSLKKAKFVKFKCLRGQQASTDVVAEKLSLLFRWRLIYWLMSCCWIERCAIKHKPSTIWYYFMCETSKSSKTTNDSTWITLDNRHWYTMNTRSAFFLSLGKLTFLAGGWR